MIKHLKHMAVFARVVEKGSFRAAAKDLGVAPSRVSQTVSDFEQYLGVALLNRTTRRLFLTNEGRLLYQHAADMLKSAETGLNELNSLSLKPTGHLNLSLPAFLASSAFNGAVSDFLVQYPQVSLSLSYSDHRVDMLDEEVDLSIRVGGLKDSSMMSRKLGQIKRLLVASKTYVETKPVPYHPNDLSSWEWIRFRVRPNIAELTASSGEAVSVSYESRLSVDSAEAMAYFARKNAGVAILPEHLAVDQLRTGELVQLFPEWSIKPLGCYAVWPSQSRRESLTLLLVRFLAVRDLASV